MLIIYISNSFLSSTAFYFIVLFAYCLLMLILLLCLSWGLAKFLFSYFIHLLKIPILIFIIVLELLYEICNNIGYLFELVTFLFKYLFNILRKVNTSEEQLISDKKSPFENESNFQKEIWRGDYQGEIGEAQFSKAFLILYRFYIKINFVV
jgi:hypothetical protein